MKFLKLILAGLLKELDTDKIFELFKVRQNLTTNGLHISQYHSRLLLKIPS